MSLPLRYDTYGRVPHVLHDVNTHIPKLFPERAPEIIDPLTNLIHRYGANDIVALSVSYGRPREELEQFIDHTTQHDGPIIIDPTARTPHHQILESIELVRVNKERMIMINQSTDDLLVILYGLGDDDIFEKLELLKRRVAGLSNAVEEMEKQQFNKGANDAIRKNIVKARTHLRSAMNGLDRRLALASEGFERDSDDFSQDMFLTMSLFTQLDQQIDDPALQAMLNSLMWQVQSMPYHFGEHVSFLPYETAALQLLNAQINHEREHAKEEELAAKKDPDHKPTPPPVSHHHRYHSLHLPKLKR
jgi:hypothetical protein